ncbi:uncharacterized protein LOC122376553 isoform X2 [Amphibalanus amphitrite]|uniref:uncharacterized protein LOC122376553 isoform X2 n=1 Tax=Amphibalanus amphitrite TaxID=1232801 RepID=UPI001C8FE0F6|nr:uncharacterized protein LOC122376553 isoform X2 [Amphibalanus amphitrite]
MKALASALCGPSPYSVMPIAPAVLVALLPLWIQATVAAAQMQFSVDWAHGKRSAVPPVPAGPAGPSALRLLDELDAGEISVPAVHQLSGPPPSGHRGPRRSCAVDGAVLRQVFDTIMREANRVAACRVKSSIYDIYKTT